MDQVEGLERNLMKQVDDLAEGLTDYVIASGRDEGVCAVAWDIATKRLSVHFQVVGHAQKVEAGFR